MRKRLRLRDFLLATATLAPLAAGISLGLAGALRPRPTLEEVCALGQAHRFDEAAARGEAYLRLYPDDSRALLVVAELALSRPTPDPDRALRWLGRIRVESPALAAWALVDRGQAYDLLGRPDRAEASWREAMRRDPSLREAGRRLLDLLTLQGRSAEARTLALGHLGREPDPHERARWLLRLARLEVDPPDPWVIVNRFEPAIRRQTADLATTLACGLALASVSRGQEALGMLRHAVERHPEAPTAWDALMAGLELAGRQAELRDLLGRLPDSLRADPRFAKHQGRCEQEAGRWLAAARWYRRAWEFEPDNTVGYRLRRALVFAGEKAEAERFDRLVLDYREAFKQVRGLLPEVDASLEGGGSPAPGLCRRMAELRQRMGRIDEARAWQDLIPVEGPYGRPGRASRP
jgi:tetratricopeptide (TPR) repeat protein